MIMRKMDSDSVLKWFEENFGWCIVAVGTLAVTWFIVVIVVIVYLITQLS